MIVVLFWLWFFFFKQKTAYEMRISDWSSDVCSSDLAALQQSVMRMASGDLSVRASPGKSKVTELASLADSFNHMAAALQHREAELRHQMEVTRKIGRASCRERVCQYV